MDSTANIIHLISINESFSFNASQDDIGKNFTDIDGDTLTYSATGLPTGFSIAGNGVVSGQTASTGVFAVKVTTADGNGGTASDTFDLIVANNSATPRDDIILMSKLTGINKDKVNAKAGNDRVTGTDINEFIGVQKAMNILMVGAATTNYLEATALTFSWVE